MSKFSPWCRAAEEDTYITHSNVNKSDPLIWQKHTKTPQKHHLWPSSAFRWMQERPRPDRGAAEMLYRLRAQQPSFSDWYHHGAMRTNALDRLFPLINRRNIYTLIHHRKEKKKSNRMKQFNTSVKEAGAIEKLAPFIIFLFLPFTVSWWIKPFEIDGVSGGSSVFQIWCCFQQHVRITSEPRQKVNDHISQTLVTCKWGFPLTASSVRQNCIRP